MTSSSIDVLLKEQMNRDSLRRHDVKPQTLYMIVDQFNNRRLNSVAHQQHDHTLLLERGRTIKKVSRLQSTLLQTFSLMQGFSETTFLKKNRRDKCVTAGKLQTASDSTRCSRGQQVSVRARARLNTSCLKT